jgi:hypothetical protein
MSALHRFTFTSLTSLALASGLGLGLTTTGCQQPQSYCTTAHGDFAAVYKLKSGDPKSACGQRQGEVLGFQTYFATGGLNNTPKFSEPSMAIRPALIGELIERGASSSDPPIVDPKAEPNAIAKFDSSFPDDEDFCEATKFSVSQVTLPELPLIPGDPDDPTTPDEDESTPDTPPQPATSIKYEWSNARVLVNANYQGTQFSADLKFTQDGCTAEYEVTGVYPLASCEADADCQDTTVTGINPDFDLKCHPSLKFCVLNGDIPALK